MIMTIAMMMPIGAIVRRPRPPPDHPIMSNPERSHEPVNAIAISITTGTPIKSKISTTINRLRDLSLGVDCNCQSSGLLFDLAI